MPLAITGKPLSITTAGSTRKRHIMLTPQAVTPSTPEITPKKRERLTPRNTARSNLPEDRHRTATYNFEKNLALLLRRVGPAVAAEVQAALGHQPRETPCCARVALRDVPRPVPCGARRRAFCPPAACSLRPTPRGQAGGSARLGTCRRTWNLMEPGSAFVRTWRYEINARSFKRGSGDYAPPRCDTNARHTEGADLRRQ
jgi:hypothetical protein